MICHILYISIWFVDYPASQSWLKWIWDQIQIMHILTDCFNFWLIVCLKHFHHLSWRRTFSKIYISFDPAFLDFTDRILIEKYADFLNRFHRSNLSMCLADFPMSLAWLEWMWETRSRYSRKSGCKEIKLLENFLLRERGRELLQ